MRHRTLIGVVASTVFAAGLLAVVADGQTKAPAASRQPYAVPRTPWGHPDLQGNWNLATLTPLERPDNVGGRLSLTKAEADAIERNERARVERAAQSSNPDRQAPRAGGNVGGYNNFWIDRGDSAFIVDGQYRTSIIIDPPDGKIPPMTAEGRQRNAARGRLAAPSADAPESAAPEGAGAFDNVEQRPLGERCLLGFGSTSGPPTLPNYFYNNYKQIVQTPDYVMILVEMVHDVRIIPLNRPHVPANIRKWMGDSVGHWEGDTLVVETTNFTDKTRFRGSSPNLKVTERFTRVSPETILYRFTVDDPATWARPWSGELPWDFTTEQIYEYACHEGNHALGDILRGARLLEAEAEQTTKSSR